VGSAHGDDSREANGTSVVDEPCLQPLATDDAQRAPGCAVARHLHAGVGTDGVAGDALVTTGGWWVRRQRVTAERDRTDLLDGPQVDGSLGACCVAAPLRRHGTL